MGRSVHKYCAVFLGLAALGLIFLSRPIAMLYISDRGELFEMVIFASVMTGISAPFSGLVKSRIAQQVEASHDDGDLHLGLQMVGGLAENLRYVHTMDSNTVIIRFKLG
jgi:hypothetical protein